MSYDTEHYYALHTFLEHGELTMKTINLTDDQFNTLFNRIDKMVKTIVDASVDYQDTEILNEWEDLFDVHSVLEEANN